MSLAINSGGAKGLGQMYKVDSAGTVVDCDSWNNFFQSVCWDPTAPTVQVAAGTTAGGTPTTAGGTPTAATALTAADVTTPSALCNFLDCDASGNLVFDTTNALWLGGAALALIFVLGMFNGGEGNGRRRTRRRRNRGVFK